MEEVTFTIPGQPEFQGSKRYVGRGIMVEDNKRLKSWRLDAMLAAQKAAEGFRFERGALMVEATFQYTRPKAHYGSGRNANKLKPLAPRFKVTAPDLDKLQRALGDALTQSGLIIDDALVVIWGANKLWGDVSETRVRVRAL